MADQLLGDVWQIPGFAPVQLPARLSWTEDPFHARAWRVSFYGLEPTSNLLWAYVSTGRAEYRGKLLDILGNYVAMDQARLVHDYARLDNHPTAARRAQSLVNLYVKLKDLKVLPADLDAGVAAAIARLAGYLADPRQYRPATPGRYGQMTASFMESAALLLIAENLPAIPGAPAWRATALGRLDALLQTSVNDEGIADRVPARHFKFLTLALNLVRWSRNANVALPPAFLARVTAMSRYGALLLRPDASVPLMGPGQRVLLARSDQALYADPAVVDPLLRSTLSAGADGSSVATRAAVFRQGPLAVLRSDDAQVTASTHVLFKLDPGPATEEPLDGLSLQYYSAGRELLGRSGQYRPGGGPAVATARESSAQSAVVVDGADQLRGVATRGLTAVGTPWAYQSASYQLAPGVVQQRSLLLLRRDLLLVVDHLASSAPHAYTQHWQIFPGAHVVLQGREALVGDERDRPVLAVRQLAGGATRAQIQYPPAQSQLASRSDLPGASAWTHDLSYQAQGGSGASFATLISSGSLAPLPFQGRIDVTPSGASGTICSSYESWRVDIAAVGQPGETVVVHPGHGCNG